MIPAAIPVLLITQWIKIKNTETKNLIKHTQELRNDVKIYLIYPRHSQLPITLVNSSKAHIAFYSLDNQIGSSNEVLEVSALSNTIKTRDTNGDQRIIQSN